MRPQEVLQRRRQAHNLLRMRSRQLSTIQGRQCQSINITFYPTTKRLRYTQQSRWQNTKLCKRSSIFARRNASGSRSSINEINNFSTTRFNASSDTSRSLKNDRTDSRIAFWIDGCNHFGDCWNNLMNAKIFPTILMILQFIAAIPYAIEGNARMTVYWIAAGVLTPALTYL